jgi:glycosyltransferase involved in cell wall biosynthesis
MNKPKVSIAIPTFNRDYCIDKAINAALHQSYDRVTVTVVDDGSSDNTYDCVSQFFDNPNFNYIQLDKNVGTARAKNVAMMFSDYDAITFHDSDDLPDPNKIMLQVRALEQKGHQADEILNWQAMGHTPGSELAIDVVVGAHKMIKLDGSVHHIAKRMSLVDDFFPNLQFPSKTEGDWILINSGLFRKSVFEDLGGYLDSVEEDREIRNRLVGTGHLFYFLEYPLLTKIEMDVSLTVSEDTGYRAERRMNDRNEVWRRLKAIRKADDIPQLKKDLQEKVDLSDVGFKFVSNPELLTFNKHIPHVAGSDKALESLLQKSA